MQAVPAEPKWTYTRPCSITGLGEAWLLKSIMTYSFFGVSKTFMSFRILPLSRATQTALRVEPSAAAVVRQTCLPKTTRHDQPLPGMAVFQTTFSSFFSSQVIGSPLESDTPEPLGPRNIVQLSAARAGRAAHNVSSSGSRQRMRTSRHPAGGA